MSMVLGLIVSYLLGSFPTAYVAGRLLKGIDIRDYGSGNVGATNAFRVLGKAWGTAVLVVDILKGVLAITLAGDLLGLPSIWERALLGVAVVSGHNWTVFLRFKGGKGIATSLGVLIGLTMKFPPLRPVLLACVLIWICLFLVLGYVSLASIIAALALPAVMALTGQPWQVILLGVVFCLFVILRHRTNIRRLLAGQEPRVSFPFKR